MAALTTTSLIVDSRSKRPIPTFRGMTDTFKSFVLVAVVATATSLGTLFAGAAHAAGDKVVVELFTSQGCSSCPPADRFLGELAKRDDVLALSFHVDYWNYLGWKDPFSSKESTSRQRNYGSAFKLRYIYTPQMVVSGTHQSVGSGRGKILRAIERARKAQRVPVTISHPDKDTALVTIAAGPKPDRPATIWLFAYDKEHLTSIRRGENEGVKLANANIVRAHRRIGEWNGKEMKIKVPVKMMGFDKQDGCAIVVQNELGGPILGSTAFDLAAK